MPPRKTPKQIEGHLAYYDEQKALGSSSPIADTAKKAHVTTRTVHNWVDRRNETPKNPEKKDTTETFTEIVKEKKIDEQTNKEHWEMLIDPRLEKMLEVIEEEYPHAKELLKENFSQVVEKTLHELDAGVTAEDIRELRDGRPINDILNDNRKPLTYSDKIKSQKEQQELAVAKMDRIWAVYQLETTENAFETENNNLQTNENYRFFDEEMMSSLRLFLELQAMLPLFTPSQQHYYKQKFMMEKGLSIFPLLERILYSNIGLQQEPQLHDEEIHNWWSTIPINERKFLLNKLNGQII